MSNGLGKKEGLRRVKKFQSTDLANLAEVNREKARKLRELAAGPLKRLRPSDKEKS